MAAIRGWISLPCLLGKGWLYSLTTKGLRRSRRKDKASRRLSSPSLAALLRMRIEIEHAAVTHLRAGDRYQCIGFGMHHVAQAIEVGAVGIGQEQQEVAYPQRLAGGVGRAGIGRSQDFFSQRFELAVQAVAPLADLRGVGRRQQLDHRSR